MPIVIVTDAPKRAFERMRAYAPPRVSAAAQPGERVCMRVRVGARGRARVRGQACELAGARIRAQAGAHGRG